MKKLSLIAVCLAVVALSGVFAGCGGSSFGIPDGTYSPCDENGVILESAPEDKIKITNKTGEYSYGKIEIFEENGELYIAPKYWRDDKTFWFKTEYDTATKILTVFMTPVSFGDRVLGTFTNMEGVERTAFYFKKGGIL